MAPVKVDPDKVHEFRDAESFYRWLGAHHDKADEVWIKMHKVGSGLPSITAKEAINVVLCWGWIDAIRKGFDDKSFLQRYTRRGRKSIWSKINVDNVARLIEEGRMTEHGLREVEAAKADGRWDRAYGSGKEMKIPDDLQAATLRSTADLMPGDQVAAVGFPFGIGPSVSAGVVSGLKRGFRSPEGKQELSNLIQFDAAANPGNSGGPLVTMDGEVVGIVTAILNPTPARTFIGIGFAVPIENAAAAAGLPPF